MLSCSHLPLLDVVSPLQPGTKDDQVTRKRKLHFSIRELEHSTLLIPFAVRTETVPSNAMQVRTTQVTLPNSSRGLTPGLFILQGTSCLQAAVSAMVVPRLSKLPLLVVPPVSAIGRASSPECQWVYANNESFWHIRIFQTILWAVGCPKILWSGVCQTHPHQHFNGQTWNIEGSPKSEE